MGQKARPDPEAERQDLTPKPEVTTEVTGEVAGEVTGEVARLLRVLDGEMTRRALQVALALRHEDHFRAAYLGPALAAGLIEMTLPDKPSSSKQRYRLTGLGLQWLGMNGLVIHA